MEAFALNVNSEDDFSSPKSEVFAPSECKKLLPNTSLDLWLYKYTHPSRAWTLSIATHGEPCSGKYSLGGFRIVPEERAALPGFDASKEALGLAAGMEEKVFWSRLVGVAGPIGIKNLGRIVGGKCVLLPSNDARVGAQHDLELLDFAVRCLHDFEDSAGLSLITGQDMGHGILSDGKTSSLKYLNDKFLGSVISDTAKPTGEGNFYALKGALLAFGIETPKARVGLIGCGNVGEFMLRRLLDTGAAVVALESSSHKRSLLTQLGVKTYTPDRKKDFLALPMDAVVVNASGGSLDSSSLDLLAVNPEIKVVCGSENLAMPDSNGAVKLLASKKIYYPTEYCGMMGYLTAVEEYLSRKEKVPFKIENMFIPAKKLEDLTYIGSEKVLESGFRFTFEDALRKLY